MLPDGTPFVAYLDGHSARGGETNLVVIQDLKTCGNPVWALERGAGEHGLLVDLQAMLYAWILLCLPHWYCPPLADGQFGPKHWQWWDPAERNAKSARLRWLYFLTKGKARAWDSTDWVTPAQAAMFLVKTIMPHVTRIVALDKWVSTHPGVTLSEFDRNLSACGGRGRFCGVAEHDGCDFSALGTPILTLITKGPRPVSNPLDRLAALTKKVQGNTAAPVAPAPSAPAPELTPVAPAAPVVAEAPKAEEPAAPATTQSTPEPSLPASPPGPVVVAAEPAVAPKRRGRPPKSAGVGINPPEEGTIAEAPAPARAPSAQAELTPVQTRVLPLIPVEELTESILAVQRLLPLGVSVTVTGVAQ
jgi:hypothetical protein